MKHSFIGESILIVILLLWSSFIIFKYSNTFDLIFCCYYVWFLFSICFIFEYFINNKLNYLIIHQRMGFMWNTRKKAGNGIVMGTSIFPISLLIHSLYTPTNVNLLPYFDALISTSLVILFIWILCLLPIVNKIPILLKFIISLLLISYFYASFTKEHDVNIEWHIVSGIMGGSVFYLLSSSFQHSFTIGEQMCIAHGLSLTGLNLVSIIFNCLILGKEFYYSFEHIITQGVIQGMFICCLFTFPIIKYLRKKQLLLLKNLEAQGIDKDSKINILSHKNLFSFSCILFYIIAFISIIFMDIIIQYTALIEPFSWILIYTFTNVQLTVICIYWVILIIITILMLSESNRPNIPNIIVRKIYHGIALIMFLPVIYLNIDFIYIAFGAAFAGMTFAEALRFGLIPPFGYKLDLFLKSFTDNRDTGVVILSHIYLLLGCACSVWINRIHIYNPLNELPVLYPIAPYCGILVLGGADSMASFIGSKYGKIKWINSNKTLEGSIAAFISLQFLVILLVIFYQISLNIQQWILLVFACLLTSLVEALTDQNDNLILPLFFEISIILASFI